MIIWRPGQRECCDAGKEILQRYRLLYMACQVRTGKSLMSMTIAWESGWKRVCFITTLKAISSVKSDYTTKFDHKFDKFTIINYESAHNLHDEYDGYILDEATKLAAFPKQTKVNLTICKLTLPRRRPVILMSGTPTPESPSQIFHQLAVSYYSPFSVHKNFYSWAREYCKQYEYKDGNGNIKSRVKQKWVHGSSMNDYSEGLEDKIKEVTKHYTVTLSQKDVGFTSFVEEEIMWVEINPKIYALLKILKKDLVYKMKSADDWISGDSPAKLQSVFHQLCSGTVIGNNQTHVIDRSKLDFIRTKFRGQKIAIYYHFVAEGEILREAFPLHTEDPELFNSESNITFICQMTSGRMGINLSSADWVVMYNIGFSATTYFQIRARMQDQARTKPSRLAWIFSTEGIEKKIYKVVTVKKAPYTLNYFKRDFL